jgi:RimJ/RimL family protein N-acetyltransferase
VLSLKAKFKDGTEVEILNSPKRIPVKSLLDYINGMIAENAWISKRKKVTMKEEAAWKKNTVSGIRKGDIVMSIAVADGGVAGNCWAHREGPGRISRNIVLGIAISKNFRGKGLGELLMRRTIAKSKKKFNPRNIFLTVAEPNKAARKLYEKVGFRKIARFPDWVENKGKYYALLWMVLK